MPVDTLFNRMEWAYSAAETYQLTAPQATVLRHVAFRSGNGRGCFESQRKIAVKTRLHRATVIRALGNLIHIGLLVKLQSDFPTGEYHLAEGGTVLGHLVAESDTLVAQSDRGVSHRATGVVAQSDTPGSTERHKPNVREREENTQHTFNVGVGVSKDKSSGDDEEIRWFKDQNFQNRAEAGTLTEEYVEMGLDPTIRYITEKEVEAWRNR